MSAQERVQQLEIQIRALKGAMDEQRETAAATAAALARDRPQPKVDVVDAKLIGKPRSFHGKEDEWSSWSTLCGPTQVRSRRGYCLRFANPRQPIQKPFP